MRVERARPPTSQRVRADSGASLVEFAIVMPLLFLLVFGVIEFGWAFVQNLDVRHGAREGVRLAAVNADPSNGESDQQRRIALELCNRIDSDGGSPISVVIDVDGSLVPDPSGDAKVNDIGDQVTVTVDKDLDQLTGFLDFALSDVTLHSSVTTRLEQGATYEDLTAGSFTCP